MASWSAEPVAKMAEPFEVSLWKEPLVTDKSTELALPEWMDASWLEPILNDVSRDVDGERCGERCRPLLNEPSRDALALTEGELLGESLTRYFGRFRPLATSCSNEPASPSLPQPLASAALGSPLATGNGSGRKLERRALAAPTDWARWPAPLFHEAALEGAGSGAGSVVFGASPSIVGGADRLVDVEMVISAGGAQVLSERGPTSASTELSTEVRLLTAAAAGSWPAKNGEVAPARCGGSVEASDVEVEGIGIAGGAEALVGPTDVHSSVALERSRGGPRDAGVGVGLDGRLNAKAGSSAGAASTVGRLVA